MKKGLMVILLLVCLVIVGSYILSSLEITGYGVRDLVSSSFDGSYVWMINILLVMLVLTVAVTKRIENRFESKMVGLDGTYDEVVNRELVDRGVVGKDARRNAGDLSYLDSEIERLKRELA